MGPARKIVTCAAAYTIIGVLHTHIVMALLLAWAAIICAQCDELPNRVSVPALGTIDAVDSQMGRQFPRAVRIPRPEGVVV